LIAYVMFQVATGRGGEVVKWLRGLDGVAEAYAIYGEHDVIAKVEVPDSLSLDTLMMETIQRSPSVVATTTFIAMEGYPRVRRRRAVGRPRRRSRRVAEEKPRRRRRARRAAAPETATEASPPAPAT